MRLWPGILSALLVVGLGAVSDWYARSDYMTDAISYLDISTAIRDGNWLLVFNPYWSIGYPLVLTATRWMFPPGPQGEWTAIHVVNLVIFVSTYLSFVYLLKMAQAYLARINGVEEFGPGSGFVLAIGTAFFLLLQLMIETVARVNPDLLVSGVFFLGTAVSLQFSLNPRIKTAILLGLILGFGYLVKAIFLPIAAFLLLGLLLLILTRSRAERPAMISKIAWVLPAMAVLTVPYIAALSMTVGFFTLGETGNLNYAWNVNHLPAATHWQGGTADAGKPIHPTQMVLQSPHVFVFPEPFHVTYPPWFNPFYWYQGYHRHFSIGNQLAALKKNLSFLEHFFVRGPRAMAALFLVALSLFFFKQRVVWWKRLLALWPIYLPSILAMGGYTMVVIEPRYLVGFWLVLLTMPFVALFAPTSLLSRRVAYAMTILVALVCAGVLAENQKETFLRAIHHETYLVNNQWKAGLYLNQIGVKPGEKVASVHGGMVCTWAKVSGVQIVAELPLIGVDSVGQDKLEDDYQLFARDPAVQQTVFALFKQAGATLVVMLDADEPPQGADWQPVPGTDWWIHRL